jgi:hypothetical protein
MNKKLFKGVFKLNRSILVLHCKAVSEKKARINFCEQISKKHNVGRVVVLETFKEGNENFVISEVTDGH